jgi:MoxR-like ATPase
MIDAIYEKIEKFLTNTQGMMLEREEVMRLLILVVFAKENIFFYGPPGTGKSLIDRVMQIAFAELRHFRYLMREGAKYDDIFGEVVEVLMRGWHDTKESLYVMKNSVSRLKEKKNRGIFSSQEELVRWATNAQAKKSVIEPNFNDVERLAKFHGVVASAHRDMNKIAYYYYKVVRGEQIPSKYRRKK